MGDFKVRYGTEVYYDDPDYMLINIVVTGEADVSCEGRTGEEDDIAVVEDMIRASLSETLGRLESEKCPYEELPARGDEITNSVAGSLKADNVTLRAFTIDGIEPNERSMRIIEQRKKVKALQAMSPEELAKKMEEATVAAQRYMDSLSPEERQKAEENARKMADEECAKMARAIEEAKRITEGGTVAAAATAAATAAAAGSRFCTNCGAPSSGGRFCSNCGSPL